MIFYCRSDTAYTELHTSPYRTLIIARYENSVQVEVYKHKSFKEFPQMKTKQLHSNLCAEVTKDLKLLLYYITYFKWVSVQFFNIL